MTDSPFVSVLMTSFNREKYIAFAIESVLASTYSHFELIIVDDCSADETVKIAKKYAALDERISVYVNEKNLGDYPNRNRAATYATGKYLKYVDSDDFVYPSGLELFINSMEQFPDAGFGLSSVKPDREKPFPFMLQPKESYNYHFFGPGLFHKGPTDAIFRKDAFVAMNGFATGRMTSDTDMWHRMALQYPVVLMQEGLVWKRNHPEQELAFRNEFVYEGEKIKWNYLTNSGCGFSPDQLKAIKRKRLKRYSGFILSGIKGLNLLQAKSYAKCFWYVSKIKI